MKRAFGNRNAGYGYRRGGPRGRGRPHGPPVPPPFLAIALLYVVTSEFTLAKCVRDQQEAAAVTSRVDQARLDKMLAEHDPFVS